MFELDRAVSDWRRTFARERAFSDDDLDELEDHLRAAFEVEVMLAPALAPERAFRQACEGLGLPRAVAREFAKVGGRAWRWLLRAGQLLFGAAFLLPVARYGITLADPSLKDGLLPGIQALLLAVTGLGGALGLLSGLTNLVMLGTFRNLREAGRARVRLLARLLTASALINLSWLVLRDDRGDLFVGYYAWLTGFAVAASALWLRARQVPADRGERPAIAP
ncbi:MAG: hypothetical protein AB7L66_11985 [Gemmatimonadales bacterium]